MRNATFVALAAVVLSGCSMHYPQTREEFRQGLVSSDSRYKFVDTYVSKRRFDDVVKSLKEKVEACFDQNVIERLTPSTTKLSYYGSTTSGSKERWDLVKQWSDGKPTPCPK